ncbi:MAG: helix-turn-helix transcriptional regulator [Ruminococcus sp.]|nr:helix-turn-helix transcriptional regulator [Ruminococcus sp.]
MEAERVRNRLTKEDVAKKLGVSMRTYCNWVKEETDIPGVALIRLSRMFGTDVSYLMQG